MGANPEVYGASFLNRLEEAADFVAAVDHPAVAPILDLGAMHINGAYADAPGRVARLGPALSHVHVSESGLAPAPASAEALAPVLARLLAERLDAAGVDLRLSTSVERLEDRRDGVAAGLSDGAELEAGSAFNITCAQINAVLDMAGLPRAGLKQELAEIALVAPLRRSWTGSGWR